MGSLSVAIRSSSVAAEVDDLMGYPVDASPPRFGGPSITPYDYPVITLPKTLITIPKSVITMP
jgi:hypothetical protein